jgi:hypothetical protein
MVSTNQTAVICGFNSSRAYLLNAIFLFCITFVQNWMFTLFFLSHLTLQIVSDIYIKI